MRLLLLGGPKFLGRAVIDAALAAGHEPTLFNRGLTGADLYPDVERITGDRDGGLDGLRGRTWDAVVDTSGYVPRIVGAGADLLRDAVGHYVFVSSISAYASFAERVDERAPVATLDDPSAEDVQAGYGGLKALCEQAVERSFPARATHVRAGLIVGPHDPTGRFTYWPHRVARGGELLVPGSLDRAIQVVDVRDLAAWLVRCAEQRTAGTYNATCDTTMRTVLDAAVAETGVQPVFVEVDPAFLVEHEVGEWLELPVWLDESQAEWRHFMDVDASAAARAGLAPRPMRETVAATLAEAVTVEGVGLTPEREAALLDAWHAGA